MAKPTLTKEQQKFVDAYAGDVKAAANAVGIDLPVAQRMVQSVVVRDAIRDRELLADKNREGVSTRLERQKFWSEFMKDPRLDPLTRLKASELLGKSECDFTERRVLEGPNGTALNAPTLNVSFPDLDERTRLIVVVPNWLE